MKHTGLTLLFLMPVIAGLVLFLTSPHTHAGAPYAKLKIDIMHGVNAFKIVEGPVGQEKGQYVTGVHHQVVAGYYIIEFYPREGFVTPKPLKLQINPRSQNHSLVIYESEKKPKPKPKPGTSVYHGVWHAK